MDEAIKKLQEKAEKIRPDRTYIPRLGKIWEVTFYSPNNYRIVTDTVLAFQTKNPAPTDIKYSNPPENDINYKGLHELERSWQPAWGVADRTTFNIRSINRKPTVRPGRHRRPIIPVSHWAGPLDFYDPSNMDGDPLIEVDPPRGDPRIPMGQQTPPFPTLPRWRPKGSPDWLPWNDPSRPIGLRPDPNKLPEGDDNPFGSVLTVSSLCLLTSIQTYESDSPIHPTNSSQKNVWNADLIPISFGE